MKKYILFDHDGVLVETEHWYFQANKRALDELGIELSLESYLEDMAKGISAWQIPKRMGIDENLIQDKRRLRNQYYQEYLVTQNIEINGVETTLAELAKGYKMAIVTTSKRADFELIHQSRQILQYMDFVLTVEDYDHAKPHPEPYLKALQQFGITADEAVVVEDSARGLTAAVNAGIDCIVVHNEFTKTQDLSAASCKVNTFTELPNTIQQLD